MNWNPLKRPEGYVGSIDDLAHEKSREIALEHDVEPMEIAPYCSQFQSILSGASRSLRLPIPKDTDVDYLTLYEKYLAASAIVGYELSVRDSFAVPKPSRGLVGVNSRIYEMLRKAKYRFTRIASPDNYLLAGDIWARNLEQLPGMIDDGLIVVDMDKTHLELKGN